MAIDGRYGVFKASQSYHDFYTFTAEDGTSVTAQVKKPLQTANALSCAVNLVFEGVKEDIADWTAYVKMGDYYRHKKMRGSLLSMETSDLADGTRYISLISEPDGRYQGSIDAMSIPTMLPSTNTENVFIACYDRVTIDGPFNNLAVFRKAADTPSGVIRIDKDVEGSDFQLEVVYKRRSSRNPSSVDEWDLLIEGKTYTLPGPYPAYIRAKCLKSDPQKVEIEAVDFEGKRMISFRAQLSKYCKPGPLQITPPEAAKVLPRSEPFSSSAPMVALTKEELTESDIVVNCDGDMMTIPDGAFDKTICFTELNRYIRITKKIQEGDFLLQLLYAPVDSPWVTTGDFKLLVNGNVIVRYFDPMCIKAESMRIGDLPPRVVVVKTDSKGVDATPDHIPFYPGEMQDYQNQQEQRLWRAVETKRQEFLSEQEMKSTPEYREEQLFSGLEQLMGKPSIVQLAEQCGLHFGKEDIHADVEICMAKMTHFAGAPLIKRRPGCPALRLSALPNQHIGISIDKLTIEEPEKGFVSLTGFLDDPINFSTGIVEGSLYKKSEEVLCSAQASFLPGSVEMFYTLLYETPYAKMPVLTVIQSPNGISTELSFDSRSVVRLFFNNQGVSNYFMTPPVADTQITTVLPPVHFTRIIQIPLNEIIISWANFFECHNAHSELLPGRRYPGLLGKTISRNYELPIRIMDYGIVTTSSSDISFNQMQAISRALSERYLASYLR